MSWFGRLFKPGVGPAPPPDAPISLFPIAQPTPPAPRIKPAAASYRRLRTGRGNTLTAGTDRIGMADEPAAADALIAMFPDANRQLCFLMAPDLRPIAVQSDGMRGIAISAYRLQTPDAALIRLRHPLSPLRFLGVTAPGQGAPDGCVIFDSLGRTRLDVFEPLPVDPATLPAPFLEAAAEICAATARPYRAAGLVALLHTLAIRPGLAETLIRVLPREELALLAASILEDPDTLALLAETMPQDAWAQRVLPALAMWRRDRAPVEPDHTLHSPASDEFAGDPLEGFGQPQAGFALTALARARVTPRRGACLLAAARNEGPYVLEWLAYHQAAGFEHAFLYTNDNWDGSDALLALLARQGVITLVHNQPGTHCGPQYKAYSHALSLLPQILDYAWTAVLDLDEFFAYDANLFGGVDDYLAWQQTQPVDAVALCWQVFAAGRNDVWRDEPTLSRFTRREPHANAHVKSIFRPRLFWHSHAHFPQPTLGAPFVFRTETGGLHHHHAEQKRLAAFAESPTAQLAWVNHYFLRSAPEALWKLARGHGDWKGRVQDRHLDMARFICRSFMNLADKGDLVEDRRILHCAPEAAARHAALRALPGVAEAEDQVKADFAQRLGRMVKAFVDAPPPPGEPVEFAPFREVLKMHPL
jgi:hypothetical protein